MENGKILLLTVDAKIGESGIRMIAQKIEPLDEVAVSQQTNGSAAIQIIVVKPDAIVSIRDILNEFTAKQGAKLVLSIKLEDRFVDIELADKYMLSPVVLDKIRVMQGVVSAEELAA